MAGSSIPTEIGNFILPIGAIRGEGTSDDYLPPKVPALPSFKLHKFVSDKLVDRNLDYRTGVIYTTNRRVWEHDDEFKEQLQDYTPIAIDMEVATLFIVGHKNEIARGALLLVSDMPLTTEGVKTRRSDARVIRIGPTCTWRSASSRSPKSAKRARKSSISATDYAICPGFRSSTSRVEPPCFRLGCLPSHYHEREPVCPCVLLAICCVLGLLLRAASADTPLRIMTFNAEILMAPGERGGDIQKYRWDVAREEQFEQIASVIERSQSGRAQPGRDHFQGRCRQPRRMLHEKGLTDYHGYHIDRRYFHGARRRVDQPDCRREIDGQRFASFFSKDDDPTFAACSASRAAMADD